uniref:uncharacterized protein LOC120341410 n=1 Tax=Styela clava TaxID=7725 RepID=UPI00193AB2E5|nr:uncharacterized protein LOC120341410 [Styela clava]
MKILLTVGLLAIIASQQVTGYKVCGDDETYKNETDEAVTEIVSRLMALRKTDWNWNILQVPMTLQLVAPEKFYEREKTIDAIKQKVKNDANKMSLWSLALHTYAAKGLCQNPRNFSGVNLVQMLEENLEGQFRYKKLAPVDGLRTYAIGLSALFSSNAVVPRYLINKLLANQNKDGSFGTRLKIVTTSMLLTPMHRLSQEVNPKYRVERITHAIKKMREYIKSNIYTDEKNHTYIGNPSSSTFGLLGLQATQESGESPTSWKCSEVMHTLGFKPQPNESDSMLVSRLLRITGRRYGEFSSPDWKCIKPDPTPIGYQPKCEPFKPETCQVKEQ